MLKIFLSDDDPFFLSLEKEIIERMIAEEKIDAALCGTARSCAELLMLVGDEGESLVFLDIDYGNNNPNGIDITALLRERAGRVRVVYTTNHAELAMQVLKSGTEPFGFLEKGCDVAELAESLGRYIRMALRLSRSDDTGGESIRLKTGVGETALLRVQDILYLEAEKSVSHGITYRTQNGSAITVISTLDAEKDKLDDRFVKIHRSFLVNKSHIIGMKNGYAVMSDQSEIPCSLKMRAEVRKWLGKN